MGFPNFIFFQDYLSVSSIRLLAVYGDIDLGIEVFTKNFKRTVCVSDWLFYARSQKAQGSMKRVRGSGFCPQFDSSGSNEP
jgi:hypothetical protein